MTRRGIRKLTNELNRDFQTESPNNRILKIVQFENQY
jgi:hypothetical protein